MKKIYILTAVLALLTLSLNAQTMAKKAVKRSAQTGKVNAPNRATASVTVGDQSSDTQFSPVYGWWYDGYEQNQMIYTAEQLGNLPAGTKITSITFYPYNGLLLNGGTIKLSLGTTSANSFTSANAISATDLTLVATITPTSNSNMTEWTITFTNDFIYNGGNLLVQTDTEGGSDNRSYFYGQQQQNNVCYYAYGYSNPPGNAGRSQILPKATFTYEESGPRIEVSPETLTINDNGGTFTVQGSNLGTDNVGVTVPDGSDFSTTTSSKPWGFENTTGSVDGTVTVTYGGYALSATETVTVANNLTSATVAVTYVPDLYVYYDNGVSPWDFSANPAVAMIKRGNGIYTAALQNIPANSHILFGRASGLTYYWEGDDNRLFFGASTDGGDWAYGDNTSGYLDTDPRNDNPVKYHPIYFPEGGSYTITIDANAYTFTIEKLVLPAPENVVATPDNENHTATVTWDAPSITPTSETVEWDFEEEADFNAFTLVNADGDNYNWYYFNDSQAVAHSGTGVATSASYVNTSSTSGTALDPDNWLISPEITLGGNLSFYACGQDPDWPSENFAVYVCEGSYSSTSDFVKIADYTATATMTEISVDLSQYSGQGYFAIRHYNMTGNDMFRLNIDDISYSTREDAIFPVSYNVYLDGELVGNVPANDALTYTFNNLDAGNYECAVSAVYTLGESEAVPADFTIMEKTATPTISVVTNADGSKTVTATGDGTVHLYIDGVEVENPYTITPSIDGDITVTATATAQEEGKLISETATETVTVPEAGRSPKPNITFTDNGDGSYTITVTGTGEVAVYIDDAEHAGAPIATADGSFSFNVEQHSQAMTITVSATNQEEGLAISRTVTETFSIPAMTIDSEFQELNPQPSNGSTPIDMSNLMFCDRFSVVIPNENNHPRLYDYYLQETQVRQRTSNSVEVPVKHTGSDGLGFYTLDQIDNDVNVGIDHDKGLKMNVRNAAMDLPLEADPNVYYYTESRGTKAYPDQAGRKYLAVLQRTSDGFYNENLTSAYDYGVDPYPGGQHHIHLDTDTITGDYNNYLAYVPIVWTMGFDRVNYETDHIHNSYGAPKWKTGVAKVEVISVNAERQTGVQGSTNWMEGSIPCSMYMIDEITAVGTMPSVNTMPYKPYMFRVFVESKNGKLRGYKKIGDGATINDATHYEGDGNGPQTGPFCIWSEYVDGSTCIGENGYEYTFSRGKISEVDSLGHWIVPDYKNIMFAAEDNLLTEINQFGQEVIQKNELNIFVRFYYIVEGADEGHTIPASGPYTGQRNRDGEAPGGYGSESPGTSPSPSTAVNEISLGSGVIVSQTFYNAQGMTSDKPFDGINIVITRYSDGTTRTTKVVR